MLSTNTPSLSTEPSAVNFEPPSPIFVPRESAVETVAYSAAAITTTSACSSSSSSVQTNSDSSSVPVPLSSIRNSCGVGITSISGKNSSDNKNKSSSSGSESTEATTNSQLKAADLVQSIKAYIDSFKSKTVCDADLCNFLDSKFPGIFKSYFSGLGGVSRAKMLAQYFNSANLSWSGIKVIKPINESSALNAERWFYFTTKGASPSPVSKTTTSTADSLHEKKAYVQASTSQSVDHQLTTTTTAAAKTVDDSRDRSAGMGSSYGNGVTLSVVGSATIGAMDSMQPLSDRRITALKTERKPTSSSTLASTGDSMNVHDELKEEAMCDDGCDDDGDLELENGATNEDVAAVGFSVTTGLDDTRIVKLSSQTCSFVAAPSHQFTAAEDAVVDCTNDKSVRRQRSDKRSRDSSDDDRDDDDSHDDDSDDDDSDNDDSRSMRKPSKALKVSSDASRSFSSRSSSYERPRDRGKYYDDDFREHREYREYVYRNQSSNGSSRIDDTTVFQQVEKIKNFIANKGGQVLSKNVIGIMRYYPAVERAAKACCPSASCLGMQLSTLFRERREWGIRTRKKDDEHWYEIVDGRNTANNISFSVSLEGDRRRRPPPVPAGKEVAAKNTLDIDGPLKAGRR